MRSIFFTFIFALMIHVTINAEEAEGAADLGGGNHNSAVWLQTDADTFEQIGWWYRIAQVELMDESTAEVRILNNGFLKTELTVRSKAAIEKLLKKLMEEGNQWIPAITTSLQSKKGYVNWNYVQKVKRVQLPEPRAHDGLELTSGHGKGKIILGTVEDPKQVTRLMQAVQETARSGGLSSSSRN